MYPIDIEYEEDLENDTPELWTKENPYIPKQLTEIPDPAKYLAEKYGLIQKKER